MDEGRLRRLRVLVSAAIALWAVIILYALLRNRTPALLLVQRAAALFGYTALFLTIVSSEYMCEMRKLFGKPFLTVHHVLAVTGLLLIVVHPLTYALRSRSLLVLVPVFSPFPSFLTWASRPALYLILLAVLAAVARRRIKDTWKSIHWLNYLAFAMVFVHAWRIGSDVAAGFLRVVWAAMAAAVVVVFVHKRLLSR